MMGLTSRSSFGSELNLDSFARRSYGRRWRIEVGDRGRLRAFSLDHRGKSRGEERGKEKKKRRGRRGGKAEESEVEAVGGEIGVL